MKTLKLTDTAIDEILHALRTSYVDYDDRLGAYYNKAMEAYNKQLDEIIDTIKQQIKEQEA